MTPVGGPCRNTDQEAGLLGSPNLARCGEEIKLRLLKCLGNGFCDLADIAGAKELWKAGAAQVVMKESFVTQYWVQAIPRSSVDRRVFWGIPTQ